MADPANQHAIWIETGGFDELMLLIRDVFDLPHPERRRFEEVFEKYTSTYEALSGRIVALPDTAPDASALKEAVKRTDESFPDWWAVEVAASRVAKTEPDRADSIYREGIVQFPASAPLLGNYGLFLQTIRKDYDGAEALYRRALAADPKDATNLGNYAHVLQQVRKDVDGAEVHYQRALAADANHASNLGNYAGFLLARGQRKEGLALLDRVMHHPALVDDPPLAAECWFYGFAHQPPEVRCEALRQLRRVLESGTRSPGWDLTANVDRARAGGHPNAAWLAKLAAVMSDDADPSTLETWPEWREAGSA